MFKRFNFTGKKKLVWKGHKTDFIVNLDSHSKNEHVLKILFSLHKYFPSNKSDLIFLEIYYGSQTASHLLGSLESVYDNVEKNFFVNEFPPELLKVRLKIVDKENGKLIASADRVTPEYVNHDKEDRKKNKVFQSSLFNFKNGEIEQPFTVVMQPGDRPIVRLNQSIKLKEELIKDNNLQSLLLPSILKEILLKYIMNDEFIEDDWRDRVLRFAEQICDEKIPDRDDDFGEIPKSKEVIEWIDRVCDNFTRDNKFINNLKESFLNNQSIL